MRKPFAIAAICTAVAGAFTPAIAGGADTVRFATYNLSLNRNEAGQLLTDLQGTSMDAG
jgi:hypothetical protein